MSVKQFNKAFGITSTLEEEQEAFINRSHHFLDSFRIYLDNHLEGDQYRELFDTFCVQLGLHPQTVIEQHSNFIRSIVPGLDKLLPRSFMNTVKLLHLLSWCYFDKQEFKEVIDEKINSFLNAANVDLGISYTDGIFFPTGENVLDQDLINHSLQALAAYPNEDKDLRNALDNYRMGKKDGVIETCYRCMEGLARQILENNDTLIDNKVKLVSKIGLSDNWKKIMYNYVEIGNTYGRHASPQRHNISKAEVEAYLYETCLLVRLLVQSL